MAKTPEATKRNLFSIGNFPAFWLGPEGWELKI
jgi:hypothetical protein